MKTSPDKEQYDEDVRKGVQMSASTPHDEELRDWEIKFDERFPEGLESTIPYEESYSEKTDEVKAFISQLLHSAVEAEDRRWRERIEGKITIKEPNDEIYDQWDLGYNSALSDLLKKE